MCDLHAAAVQFVKKDESPADIHEMGACPNPHLCRVCRSARDYWSFAESIQGKGGPAIDELSARRAELVACVLGYEAHGMDCLPPTTTVDATIAERKVQVAAGAKF